MAYQIVLDTSVIIKWFRQGEVLADHALRWRDAYLQGEVEITVPSLVAYELANVLRYKDDLTTDQVEAAVQSLFNMGLRWVAPSAASVCRAVAIAREQGVTVYDAIFVSLAEALGADLITADERLVHRLTGFSFVHFLGAQPR